jgi:hypothetical protein
VFPLTHLHVAREVLSQLDEEIAVGSIFPDTIISMPLKWDETHLGFNGFFECLKEEERTGNSGFLAGFMTHGVEPRGLDYYGDVAYGGNDAGYSFQKSAFLVPAVSDCLGVDEETARWKAHNFVEMGAEMLISKENPDLGQALASGLGDMKLIRRISGLLSRFYGLKREVIEGAFGKFRDFIEPRLAGPEELAAKYLLQLGHRHGLGGLDLKRMAGLICEGEKLVRDDLYGFLAEIIPEIREEIRIRLKKYLPSRVCL